jgi:hypothetical protein
MKVKEIGYGKVWSTQTMMGVVARMTKTRETWTTSRHPIPCLKSLARDYIVRHSLVKSPKYTITKYIHWVTIRNTRYHHVCRKGGREPISRGR